jgi:PAS domain S-box-containing protein
MTATSDALQTGLPEAGKVRRAQLSSFSNQTPLNAAITTLTSLSAAAAMWHGAPSVGVLLWAAAHLLQTAFVSYRWYAGRSVERRPTASVRGMRRAIVFAGISGLTWGSAVLLLAPLDELHRMAVLVIMGGMLAGGTITLGVVPAAAGTYIFAIAVPSAVFFLLQGSGIYALLAGLTLVYSGALYASAYMVYGTLIRNLRAEQANADLLREFRAERSEWLDIAETAEAAALFDAEGRLLLWNSNFLDVLSLPAALVEPGARYADLLRAAAKPLEMGSRRRLDDWIAEQTASNDKPAPDLVVALGNGRRVRARAQRTPSGRIALSFVDITAITTAESARRDSERRAEVIVDNAIDIVTILAPDGIIRFESPSVTDVLGWTPQELVGRQVLDLIHPDDRDVAMRAMTQATPYPQPGPPIELRLQHKDGSWRQLEVHGRNLHEEPSIGGLLINSRDITERKAAQQAVARSEQQLRLVIDNLPALIAYCSPERRLLYVNPAAARWYGRPTEQVVGRLVSELMPASEYAQIGGQIDRALGGEWVHEERRANFPGRPPRVIEYDYIPDRAADGSVRGFVALAAEVTERRAMEEHLRQAQKMEAVGQLTGGIAHDFNNLLGVIVGNIDLLRTDVADPKLQSRLDRVIAAAERGAALTQRLLAFARRQTLQPQVTDIGRLVGEMTALLRRALGETIRMEVSREDGLWPCLIDPSQLESAILNLAVNARDAMPQGGRLTIATRNTTVDAADAAAQSEASAGEFIQVAVTDTGTGMTPEVAARAFEPFFTTKDVGQGSGLGLSMVYGFVRQSGGHVRLVSTPDRGTSVLLYLPRAQTQPGVAVRPVPGAARATAGRKILVVEDNPDMRTFSANALRQLGHIPVAVDGAEPALATLAADPEISVMFADVVIGPGMSGAELATEVRKRWPTIKILLTSGFAEGAGLGAEQNTPFLPKPFRIADLGRELGKLLETATR